MYLSVSTTFVYVQGWTDSRPAMRESSANWSTESGAASLGFTITEFPAARAGAIFLIAISNG